MLDVSVIIVSYNTAGILVDCLSSLQGDGPDASSASLAETGVSAEIIVVDNGSSDGSQDVVRARFPDVHLIANIDNRGFAAANNQALRVASGRYLLLLNSDTVVLGDAIAKLVEFLDRTPRAGVAGARLLNPDGTHQHSAFRFPDLWQTFLDFFPINHRLTNSRLNGRYSLPRQDAPFEIDHPLGACMMVRREAMAEVGMLDERFFMYCEEVDWCMRMRKSGWRAYCVPQARVIHYGGQSAKLLKGAMYGELYKSRALLFRKHYSTQFRIAARWIIRLGLWRERLRAQKQVRLGLLDANQLRQQLETLELARRAVEEYA